MNSVSWFIYLSEVCSNIKTLCGVIGFAGIIPAVIYWLVRGFVNNDNRYSPGDDGYVPHRIWTICPIIIIAILIFSVLPSKSTIYAIAASQLGEKVLQDEEVQGITSDAKKALRIWIQKQISEKDK